MADIKQQWKKRVEVFKCIYSELVDSENIDIKSIAFSHYSFDKSQMEIIEYYANNKNLVIDIVSKNIDKSWTWERIPLVEKAILLSSLCEFTVLKIAKPIIIDQALVTLQHYGDPKSKKYINAILEKVLV